MTHNYKYEIAFSFLFQDEKIAYALNDLIIDQVQTFIYSKRQEELGGSDGELAFNKVFAEQSRTVVVIYRDGWGNTPWTRIEETAIRNRAFNEGWNFVTFILLDKKSKVPIYLPKAQLWVDYERWGLKGAASRIEQSIKDAGGEVRQETIQDRIERFKRLKKATLDRTGYLKSQQALTDANAELTKILLEVKELPQSIQDEESRLYFATKQMPNQFFEFGFDGLFLLFMRLPLRLVNFLEENILTIVIYQKEGEPHINYKETIIKKGEYQFDQSLTGELGWIGKTSEKDFKTSREIIDYWVKKYLDELERRKLKKSH